MILKLLVVFIISTSISLWISPKVKKFGAKYKFFDKPDKRKQRVTPMVRVGGLGIAFSYFLTIFLVLFFNKASFLILSDDYLAFTILLGSFFFLSIGMADDLIDISPFAKLVFQIIISYFIFSQGLEINFLNSSIQLFSNFEQFFTFVSPILTVVWIVGVTNAINWMDGLDGLASGFVIIASFSILIISIINGQEASGIMIASLLGSTLGFLQYNYFPSKILMGDSGSYFLGFNLACIPLIGLRGFGSSAMDFNQISPSALLISFLILMIPIIDMAVVIFKRISNGNSPFFPDRNHLHHKIFRLGVSEEKTVLIIYSLSFLSSIIAVSVFLINQFN